MEKKLIFIVDDNQTNLNEAAKVLEKEYRVLTMTSAEKMFKMFEKMKPDLILLDVEMPDMTGIEAMIKIKEYKFNVPVIFLTSLTDETIEARGIEVGAVDFIMKPVSKPVLVNRVNNHLKIDSIIRKRTEQLALRTAQLARLKNGIVFTLADVIESRDENTGGHVERTTEYLEILIEEMLKKNVYADELQKLDLDMLASSARLHDVGKIVIPDSILNKPGKLTDEEFEKMKTHTQEGEKIIRKIIERTGVAMFLQDAHLFAAYHHERWDGRGYPYGLKGLDIPLHGRIMAVIDVFDALVSARPYKPAFSRQKAISIIAEEKGKHFDPLIADVFIDLGDKL